MSYQIGPRTGTEFFVFDTLLPRPGGAPDRLTIVYCSTRDCVASRLSDRLAKHFDTGVAPDRVVLLGPESSREVLVAVAAEEHLRVTLPAVTRYVNTPQIVPVTFDSVGAFTEHHIDGSTQSWAEPSAGQLRRDGLTALFRTHRAVMDASGGYHYVKPSKKHSGHFIRSANVLLYGAETSFVAACLLPLLPPGPIRRIYTDTSSINPVAYGLIDVLCRLDPQLAPPTVDSFSSYSGIDGQFELEDAANSLCLISASTSGGLEEIIQEKHRVPRDRQITLFYVGPELPNSKLLCDATRRGDDLDGVEPFESWQAADCPLCEQGQSTVVITGDQFLPANPTVTPRMIRATDAPGWLGPVMRDIYGRDVVRCHTGNPGSSSPPRALYLDLRPLVASSDDDLSENPLAAKLERYLVRDVPAGTRWVVHLDDPASVVLADRVVGFLNDNGQELPLGHRVSARALTMQVGDYDMPEGVVLVLAGAVVSGRSLLGVSQALRRAHPGGPVAYLVLAARTATAKHWRDAASNLQFGDSGPGEHRLAVVQELELPDDRAAEGSPWRLETEFWQKLLDEDENGEGRPLTEAVRERIAVLDAALIDSEGGLRNDLFLPSPLGERLQLQPNFVFWRNFSYASDVATQAEVFMTVTAVVHALRQDRPSVKASLSHDHNWTVLAPGNFARFNDAVIQAALLRAARRFEIDYSADSRVSRDMAEILKPILASWDGPDGAAAPEFLLALAQGRLRLVYDDADELLKELESASDWMPIILWALTRAARRRVQADAGRS